MANFHGHQMPQAGRNLMAKLIATQRPLVYSSVKVGDGVLGGKLISGLTDLISFQKSFSISATPTRSGDGRWNVTAIFNNGDIAQDFWWREWGVYATDPDTGQEVLVAYANAGDTADYIHAWTGGDDSSYVEEQITCACVVSSELTVEAVIDKSQLFAPLEDFEAHRDNRNNPHGTTVDQIGAASAGHTHTLHELGAAMTATYQATFPAAGWSGAAPYQQTVAVPGITVLDNPIAGQLFREDNGYNTQALEAWGYVSRIITSEGTITGICFEDRPGVDIDVQLKVVR